MEVHGGVLEHRGERLAWSLAEVSSATGLSLGYLRNEIAANRLPIRRFGRRVLVRDEDLQKFLAEGSKADKAAA